MVLLIFNHRGYGIRIHTRESSVATAIDYYFSVENRIKVGAGGAKIEYGPFFTKTVSEAALDSALFNQALEDMRDFACEYVDRLISFMPSEASSSVLDQNPLAGG